MKEAKTLLEKYTQGLCTKEEKEEVLQWLEFNKEEESTLSIEELTQVKSEMWLSLSRSINKNKTIPLYRRTATSLAVAASLMLIIFLSGVFKVSSSLTTDVGQLEIASGNGNILSVHAGRESLKICFDGYIQFVNNSKITTTITYGDTQIKTFQLEPGKTYYMEKFKGVPYIFNEDDLPLNEDPSRYLRGKFSIDCNAA